MKDWDYYNNNTVPYPDLNTYKKNLIKEINEAKLTSIEREKLRASVDDKAKIWYNEARKPYLEEQARLESEFWADCREELGYGKMLSERGMSVLEAHAYQRGHAHGFSEIYGELIEAFALITDLAEHTLHDFKTKNNR